MVEEKKDEAIEVKVKIIPDFKNIGDVKRVYANYLSVSHDVFGFVLTFCDNHFEAIKKEDLKEKDEEGSYIIKAPIVSQIIVSTNLMPEIIKACQSNYNKFLEKANKLK